MDTWLWFFPALAIAAFLFCWVQFYKSAEQDAHLGTLRRLARKCNGKPLSRHTKMVQTYLFAIISAFDRMFGTRLISLRATGVSFWYTTLSIVLAWLVLCFTGAIRGPGIYAYYIIGSHIVGPSIVVTGKYTVSLALLLLGGAAALIFVGTLPLYTSRRIWLGCWVLILIGILVRVYPGIGYTQRQLSTISDPLTHQVTLQTTAETFVAFSHPVRVATLGVCVVLGLSVTTAFVALFRCVVRWISALDSLWKMTVAIMVYGLVSAVFLFAPVLLIHLTPWPEVVANTLSPMQKILEVSLAFLVASNVLPIGVSTCCLVSISALSVHRSIWPTVRRVSYRVQEMNTADRRKWFTRIALGILTLGASETLKALLQLLPGQSSDN